MNEHEARAVWQRAAELQAEAAQRHQREARLLGPGDETEGPGTRLTVDAVREAGVEAGIASEYIDLALAEARLTADSTTYLDGWKDRAATRQLGTDQRRIALSRIVDAPPARVLQAMERILPNAPYRLTLEDSIGDDPLNGATLLFRVPKISATSYNAFTYTMYQIEIQQIGFTLRPQGDGAATEVALTTSLGRSRKKNWIAANAFAGFFGATGGLIGFGVAKGMALAGAVVAAPITLGLAAGGGLTLWGMRAAYRSALRKGHGHFESMLGSIAMDCRLGPGFFSPRPERRDDLESGDTDTLASIIG